MVNTFICNIKPIFELWSVKWKRANKKLMLYQIIFSTFHNISQLYSQPYLLNHIKIEYTKVNFFVQFTKMELITFQTLNIQTCFSQFLWLFSLKCWFKGQIISRIDLSLPNAYKLMCFDRNINGNRDDKFFDWDYWSLHWPKKITLCASL